MEVTDIRSLRYILILEKYLKLKRFIIVFLGLKELNETLGYLIITNRVEISQVKKQILNV
jgi:hypothetical protein